MVFARAVQEFLKRNLGREAADDDVVLVPADGLARPGPGAWETRIRRSLRRCATASKAAAGGPVLVCDLLSWSAVCASMPEGAPMRVWGAAAGKHAPLALEAGADFSAGRRRPRPQSTPAAVRDDDPLVADLVRRLARLSLDDEPQPRDAEKTPAALVATARVADFVGPVQSALAAAGLRMCDVGSMVLLNVHALPAVAAGPTAAAVDVAIVLRPAVIRVPTAGMPPPGLPVLRGSVVPVWPRPRLSSGPRIEELPAEDDEDEGVEERKTPPPVEELDEDEDEDARRVEREEPAKRARRAPAPAPLPPASKAGPRRRLSDAALPAAKRARPFVGPVTFAKLIGEPPIETAPPLQRVDSARKVWRRKRPSGLSSSGCSEGELAEGEAAPEAGWRRVRRRVRVLRVR